MSLTLYRIEHSVTGLGPYVGWNRYEDEHPEVLQLVEALRTKPDALGTRPHPGPDMMLFGSLAAFNEVQHGVEWAHWFHYDDEGFQPERERYEWACAFARFEQLYSWFPAHELAQLAGVGFQVVELELVESAAFAHGRCQSVYRTAEVAGRTVCDWARLIGDRAA